MHIYVIFTDILGAFLQYLPTAMLHKILSGPHLRPKKKMYEKNYLRTTTTNKLNISENFKTTEICYTSIHMYMLVCKNKW